MLDELNFRGETFESKKIIYLDTCALIELSRYEKGCCTNKYVEDIGKLYDLLIELKKSGKMLCPLGNQAEEMAATKNREDARRFLSIFTNAELYLPGEIHNKQLDVGFSSYKKADTHISIRINDVFNCSDYLRQRYKIFALPRKSEEIAKRKKETKQKIADALNEFKQSVFSSKDLKAQYENELLADYQVVECIREKCKNNPSEFMEYEDILVPMFVRTGISNLSEFIFGEISGKYSEYLKFLTSQYHSQLPYIHIEAVLYAHLMRRSNKVKSSDRLDVLWASAYLPFIDYAVTDGSFCRLLNDSGLAEKYLTKVYEFSTIKSLIEDISLL